MGGFAFCRSQRAGEIRDRPLQRLELLLVVLTNVDQFGLGGRELRAYAVNLRVGTIFDDLHVFVPLDALLRQRHSNPS